MGTRTMYDADGSDDRDESQVAVMPCDVVRGICRGREGFWYLVSGESGRDGDDDI